MRRWIGLTLALAACAPDAPDADLDASQRILPPIRQPEVFVGNVVQGRVLTVDVRNLDVGSTVHLGGSLDGEGQGPCLGTGVCMGILNPTRIGTRRATKDSVRFRVRVPRPLRAERAWFQVVVDTPLAGSIASEVSGRTVFAQPPQKVEVCDPSIFADGPTFHTDGEIEGDALFLHIGYSGCSPRPFDACWDGDFVVDTPVQAPVVLGDETAEWCDAWWEDDIVLDISAIRRGYEADYGNGGGPVDLTIGSLVESYEF